MSKPTKLNQVIAIEKGVKSRVYAELSESHRALQKDELFKGHAKTYRPKDDDPTLPTGEVLPDDTKIVQAHAEEIIKKTTESLTELFDVAAMRDWGNCAAKADIAVDGRTIVADVPVTYLLFLEKQLSDLHTFVKKLPTLDASETWSFNTAQDLFATVPTATVRTKKITRPLVLYPHTEEHPAQVKEVTEDVMAGTWTTIKYSASLPSSRVNDVLRRVEGLQKAVKFARESANGIEVDKREVGNVLLSYLFAK